MPGAMAFLPGASLLTRAQVLLMALATVLWMLVTASVRHLYPDDTLLSAVSAGASILGYYITAWQIARGLDGRAVEFREATHPRRRRLAYAGFALLGVSCATLLVISVVNLVRILRDSEQDGLSLAGAVTFHVGAPLVGPAVFAALVFKVNAARMLDLQKRNIQTLAKSLNRFEMPPDAIIGLEKQARLPTNTIANSYQNLLDDACEGALRTASLTGQQLREGTAGDAVILFLADTKGEVFVPVASAGTSPRYKQVLAEFRPPFWRVDGFVARFNEHARMKRHGTLSAIDLLEHFREESKDVVSTTGVVYAIERKLCFDHTLRSSCLTFRFEPFNQMETEDRPAFQQLVGIPVTLFRRKLGVLLFLGSRRRAFHENDAVYWIVGDLIGAAVQLGIMLGYFRRFGLGGLFTRAVPVSDPASPRVARLVTLLNSVSADFRREIT